MMIPAKTHVRHIPIRLDLGDTQRLEHVVDAAPSPAGSDHAPYRRLVRVRPERGASSRAGRDAGGGSAA